MKEKIIALIEREVEQNKRALESGKYITPGSTEKRDVDDSLRVAMKEWIIIAEKWLIPAIKELK